MGVVFVSVFTIHRPSLFRLVLKEIAVFGHNGNESVAMATTTANITIATRPANNDRDVMRRRDNEE